MKFHKSSIYTKTHIPLFLIPLLFLIILRILEFDGLYGQDSYEYLRYTKAIKEYFVHGIHPGNYYWPVLYPFLGSLLSFITDSEIISLQIITSLSLSFCFLYILKTIRLLYPKHPFSLIYIIVFGVLSPFFLKMSLVVMSDVTAAMFVVLSFYFFAKKYTNQQTRTYPIFFFATCAFLTRYPSLFITFPIILYAFYILFKRKDVNDFIFTLITCSLPCIPFFLLQKDSLFSASSNYFLNSWSLMNYFRSSYITVDGLQSYRFPNLIHSLYIFVHPGFIFIGFILSFIYIKKLKVFFTFPQKMILTSIILYLIFLTGIPFQNTRVLGVLFPIVLLLLFPAFSYLSSFAFIKKHLIIICITSIVIQISMWLFTFQHTYKRAAFENKMVKKLTPYQGKKLFSFDVDIALQGRGLNFDYNSLYKEKVSNFELNDLVLFHPTKFLKQWSGKALITNWDYLNTNYQLKIIEEGPEGWCLYQIQIK